MTVHSHSNKISFKTTTNNSQMSEELEDFGLKMKNAIEVQRIDTNLYMSKELWLPYGSRGAFGGQIVAQSLRAAWDTVPENFFVHSLHAYFILACNVDIPVIYSIQRVRDGKSFATRIVKATQKGKAIFICSFSFSKPEEGLCLSHQVPMPNVPDPDSLPSEMELLRVALDNAVDLPEKIKQRAENRLRDDQPIEYKGANETTLEEVLTGDVQKNCYQQRWFKTRGALEDDLKIHTCIIAYASDSGFLNTAATASGYTFNSEGIGMMTSLDHTVWFHAPARADEWLLYDIHSPRTSNGRGVAFGKIYNREGVLVATTAQEGIVRLSKAEQKRLQQANQELEKELNNTLKTSKL